MLPRVATTTGTAQPTPVLQAGVATDAAVKPPQLSAAALANLRAEVLLRLLETMLKHMPRGPEPNPGRDLIETLIVALKTLPGREAEGGRKLADLLAKLPPELRPSVEKLIGTVLSSMPTRNLIEVVRNPAGPEAQRLATLLAASLTADDLPQARGENQQRPLGLNAQQLVAVSRHSPQQAAQPIQILGDARTLQTMLKRIFDFDGGAKPRPVTARAIETIVSRQEFSAPARLPTAENKTTPQTEQRLPTAAIRTGHEPPVDATARTPRHNGGAEEPQIATPAVKREEAMTVPGRDEMPVKARIANAAGQALARSVLQAVARDVPPALVMQAVAHLMENLTPEEANFLRALLERPLEPTAEQARSAATPEQAEQAIEPEMAPDDGKLRPASMQTTPALPEQAADATEALPIPQARETLPATLADATPDRLLPVIMPRDGVPLAFVPYLPAEEDLEWSHPREAEKDEETDEDNSNGEEEDREAAGEDTDAKDGPDDADMAKRREKTAEMVGVIEPGLVFYQKLGDYWT